MADHMIYRGADGFGKAMIVQWCRNGLLLIHNIIVTDLIEFVGGDAGLDVRLDHFQHFRGQAAGHAHFFYFFRGFYDYAHIRLCYWRR